MDAAAVYDPRPLLAREHRPRSYPAPLPTQQHDAQRRESDHDDLDAFIEQRLRDGTSSLYADAVAWMERWLLVRVLAQTGGNKSRACQILGITRGSLRHKICQLGIAIQQTVSIDGAENR